MSVTIEQMKPKLYTLDYAREVLALTEPLGTANFTVGDDVRFTVERGWQHGLDAKGGTEAVGVAIHIGRGAGSTELQLTKDAALQACSIVGVRKGFDTRCPAELLEPALNYWFREGLYDRAGRDFQLLTAAGYGAAITRARVTPFSNLRLLDQALDVIEARYGAGEVLVDYKLTHNLRQTKLRLIIPEYHREITNSGVDADDWSVGIQLKNSLTGEKPTSIDGYLFRWWCTNGAIDTKATSGAWTRRASGSEAEVYEWARSAVDGVLGGLEHSLDAVQAMTEVRIDGEASDVLRDVFEHYRVPVPERAKITDNLLNTGGPLTMYAVMAAVTQVANDITLDSTHAESLLRLGGDLPHAEHSRCEACRRLARH